MSWVAAGVAVAGIVVGEVGRRKAAKDAKKERRGFVGLQLEQATRRNRVAGQLEELANKLLSDTPLSPQERNVLDQAQQVANTQINRQTEEAKRNALAEQAASGFLKSGRNARQIRRLNIESAEARGRISLSREQAIQQIVEGRRQQAMTALSAAGGIGLPQFQQFPTSQNSQQAVGGALTQLGGAFLSRGGLQGGGGTTGGTPGGSQVQTPAGSQARLDQIFKPQTTSPIG